ncbi:MORN repeat protein [Leptospira noguchii]|uniref:MORN repeat protein n=1 Tax=Leptospira noguchii TaxID=28182 RepID=UPI0002BDAA0B|nr:MORN repeat protein [Leptospira noguchii]EMI63735.1 MORN repeat protein [Leptospira noguchii str. Bonito]
MFKLKMFFYSVSIFSQTKESYLFGDCKDGKGIFRDNFGNEYEGTFILGKLEGFAEVKFKNNETFFGIRNNSMRIGKGQRTDSNTGKVVYGTWIEGRFCDDEGCESWRQFISDSNIECVFRGTFLEGKKTGNGSYTCNNRESFEGTYSNDLANGNGKMIYSDRTVQVGEFKDGRLVRKKKSNKKRKSSDKIQCNVVSFC